LEEYFPFLPLHSYFLKPHSSCLYLLLPSLLLYDGGGESGKISVHVSEKGAEGGVGPEGGREGRDGGREGKGGRMECEQNRRAKSWIGEWGRKTTKKEARRGGKSKRN
jgi:hypothetical protein